MSNSAIDAHFRDGCEQGQLRLQRCTACEYVQFYPRVACSACGSDQLKWFVASGQGKIASYTVVRLPISQQFADLVPYVAALVDLQEGPRMMSVIVDSSPDQVCVGQAVRLAFRQWGSAEQQPIFTVVAPQN